MLERRNSPAYDQLIGDLTLAISMSFSVSDIEVDCVNYCHLP
jgi:hypothetical protein